MPAPSRTLSRASYPPWTSPIATTRDDSSGATAHAPTESATPSSESATPSSESPSMSRRAEHAKGLFNLASLIQSVAM